MAQPNVNSYYEKQMLKAVSDSPFFKTVEVLTTLWDKLKDIMHLRFPRTTKKEHCFKWAQDVKLPEIKTGATLKWHRYDALPETTEPLMEGRVPSKWLLDHMWDISREDFYNFDLTEEDLKKKYGGTDGN